MPVPLAAGPASPPAVTEIEEELTSALSDIDFQMDYGSPEEAKIEIENALELYPGHPELLNRLQVAEDALHRLGHQTKAPAEPEADEGHSFFDLTDVLGDALLETGEGEEMHDATNVVEKIQSVDELFNAFREGVEQQVKGDDYDTHYNLGIAYKEMMLLEPAMEEFKKAMLDPERTLECCSMLSICELAQGNLETASEWLRKGIEAPGFPPEDAIGLRYDLGDVLVQQGKKEEAIEQFQLVSEIEPDYREVAQRLR
jgi:tetratricopeptide (TPR) repeat protein